MKVLHFIKSVLLGLSGIFFLVSVLCSAPLSITLLSFGWGAFIVSYALHLIETHVLKVKNRMMLTTKTHQQYIKDLVQENFNNALAKRNELEFCWESVLDNFEVQYIMSIGKEMADCARKDIDNNYSEYIRLSDRDKVVALSTFNNLFIKHNIKEVKYQDYQDNIKNFMKVNRSIDLDSMSEEDARIAVLNEAIIAYEDSLPKSLNMTHVQFMYLFQKGKVLL